MTGYRLSWRNFESGSSLLTPTTLRVDDHCGGAPAYLGSVFL
jgi:hypothetical protein